MSSTEISRRDLLRASAAIAAAAPLLTAQSPNDTIRVAVIGVGTRGSFLLENTLKVPGVKVVAICDLDPQRAAAAEKAVADAGGSAKVYSDFRRMLADRKDIDAVLIATPVDTHKMIAVATLEVGKNVYCEKPMATNAADVEMM